MTEEFTASNGITLSFDEEGRFTYSEHGDDPRLVGKTETESWWGFTEDSRNSKALAEYYRAKEDERLGRWRWPENPDYVVYPASDVIVRVFRESTSASGVYYRTDSGENTTENMGLPARAYFDAHPEPKPPWHEAKLDEAWLLTFTDNTLDEGAYVAGDWSFIAADHAVPKDDHRITAARKIWPTED